MPDLVRLYIHHVILGFVIAAIFVGTLFWFNVANLWHLVSTSDIGWLAALLLVVFNGIVFSGVQFGIAIMRMSDDGSGDDGGRRDAIPAMDAIPVPVRDEPRHRV